MEKTKVVLLISDSRVLDSWQVPSQWSISDVKASIPELPKGWRFAFVIPRQEVMEADGEGKDRQAGFETLHAQLARRVNES